MTTDKLMVEEIEKLAKSWDRPAWDKEHQMAVQLLDTMRENERLLKEIEKLESEVYERGIELSNKNS